MNGRSAVTFALLAACRGATPSGSAPAAAVSTPADTGDANAREDLTAALDEVDRRIAAEDGDGVGTARAGLYERKGDLLLRLHRADEAARAYEQAAVDYGRTPEATTMPQVRADRAREKARQARGQPAPR